MAGKDGAAGSGHIRVGEGGHEQLDRVGSERRIGVERHHHLGLDALQGEALRAGLRTGVARGAKDPDAES